jgi:hypothetical protein
MSAPSQPTIVDILSDAYARLNRNLWIVLIPLAINAALWFGPAVSFAQIFTDAAVLLREAQPDDAPTTTPEMLQIRDQTIAVLDELGADDMRPWLAWLNVVPYAIYGFRAGGASGEGLGLPFVTAQPAKIDPETAIFVDGFGGLVTVFALVNLIGLLASTLYLVLVARSWRRDGAIGELLMAIPKTLARLLLYPLAVVVVGLLVLIPVSIFGVLLMTLNPAFGAFLFFIGSAFWLWATIYIGFTRECMVLHDVGPFQAIKASIALVRGAFWRVLGFLGLMMVVAAGSGIIFAGLVDSTAGRVGVVLASAYLFSGLSLARMRFVQLHTFVQGA